MKTTVVTCILPFFSSFAHFFFIEEKKTKDEIKKKINKQNVNKQIFTFAEAHCVSLTTGFVYDKFD